MKGWIHRVGCWLGLAVWSGTVLGDGAPWTYDAGEGTISDGNWTFNVAVVEGTELRVVSKRANANASTVVDFSTPISGGEYTIVELGSKLFYQDTSIREVTLPNTLKKVNGTTAETAVFRGCSNLTRVTPFLPETVAYLGQCAFDGCSKLTGDLVVNAAMPGNNSLGHQFNGAALTSVDLGENVTSLGRAVFYQNRSLTNVVIRGAESIGVNAFNGCNKLQNVWFYTKPTLDSSSFSGTPSTARFFIPRGNEAWAAFRANSSYVTPWADLSPTEQAKYTNAYPSEPLPLGQLKPASGLGTGWLMERTLPGQEEEHFSYELSVLFPAGAGEVSAAPLPDGEGKYLENTEVTLTASSTTRPFVRWFGAVSASQVSNATITVQMVGPLTVVPYFAPVQLEYDTAAQTITDGYWTFQVADLGNRTLRVVSVVSAVAGCGLVDLSVPVGDGSYTITEFGERLFFDNDALTEIKLPNTLKKLNGSAIDRAVFRYCDNLTTVTPLLPETLEVLGCCAFDMCPSLRGNVVLNESGKPFTMLGSGGGEYHYFNGTKITSAILGKGIKTVPRAMFYACTALTNVVLQGVESIGVNAFANSSNLRDVWLYAKPTLESNSFAGTGSKVRFHVSRVDDAWIAFMDDPTMMTPWANIPVNEKATYTNAYPGEPLPVGRATANARLGSGWIFTWIPPGQEPATVIFML